MDRKISKAHQHDFKNSHSHNPGSQQSGFAKKSPIIAARSANFRLAGSAKLFACSAFLLVNTSAFSVSLDSPADINDSNSAMYTVEDLYNRLHDGTAGAKRTTTFTEPSSGPSVGAGDHDLNDVMGKMPELNDTDGALSSQVKSGKKYWSLRTGEWGLQTGSANPAPVVKTGQTNCYDSNGTTISCGSTNQDGDLLKGVDQATPRFTDNDDGVIIDNTTGLVWLTRANCIFTDHIGFDAEGSPDGMVSWGNALDFVAAINNGTRDCGDLSNGGVHNTDWRLPNVRELQSLIDYQNSNPALPTGHLYGDVANSWYWSSTSLVGITTQAWVVNLEDGATQGEIKSTAFWHVWPVRGGE